MRPRLTSRAIETAKYLSECLVKAWIQTTFEIVEVTAGAGTAERRYNGGLGVNSNEFVVPSINILRELEKEDLIQLEALLEGNYRVTILSPLLNPFENNFGEPMQQPKSQPPQKLYKELSEEQWDFLKVLSTALNAKQISADNKSEKGFYIKPIPNDEANVVEIRGIKKQFWEVNRKKLSISMEQIFGLVEFGFLEIAPMNNFYLKAEEIHEASKYYESLQNTNSIPNISSQYHCDIFMVMPFRDGLNDVYDNIIVPLSRELSLSIKRGDERQRASASIVDEVLEYIRNAKIILVDCTEIEGKPNGNVYYELGFADALGNDNVILISQTDAVTLPFDIRHRGVIHYKDNAKGIGKLREDLKKEIQSILGS